MPDLHVDVRRSLVPTSLRYVLAAQFREPEVSHRLEAPRTNPTSPDAHPIFMGS